MSKRVYNTASWSLDLKDAVTRLTLCYKEAGIKTSQFNKLLLLAELEVPSQTISRWKRRKKSGMPIIKTSKMSGRPRGLTTEQEEVLVGFVLQCSEENKICSLNTVKNFLLDNFDKDLKKSYISMFLRTKGFASRKCREKSTGFKFCIDQNARLYKDFLQRAHEEAFSKKSLSQIGSIDCTFSSNRNRNVRLYSLRGG